MFLKETGTQIVFLWTPQGSSLQSGISHVHASNLPSRMLDFWSLFSTRHLSFPSCLEHLSTTEQRCSQHCACCQQIQPLQSLRSLPPNHGPPVIDLSSKVLHVHWTASRWLDSKSVNMIDRQPHKVPDF